MVDMFASVNQMDQVPYNIQNNVNINSYMSGTCIRDMGVDRNTWIWVHGNTYGNVIDEVYILAFVYYSKSLHIFHWNSSFHLNTTTFTK